MGVAVGAPALTSHDGAAPLGDVQLETLIAIGLSGSAAFLTAYIDGVQPLVEVFDGFLIDAPVQPAAIRTDLDAPTFVFVTDSDLPAFASPRQPATDAVRTWEVAGAAHVDGWLLDQLGGGFASSCPGRLNQGPHHQTLRAATAPSGGLGQDRRAAARRRADRADHRARQQTSYRARTRRPRQRGGRHPHPSPGRAHLGPE